MSEQSPINPVVIDLGKVKRKQIKALKRNRGKLVSEVHAVVDQVRSNLGAGAEDKEIVPVVICYRQKRRRRKLRPGDFLFPCR